MKDLKGAESVAEIIKLDLRDYYDTDKIYVNVIATDINTYKIIIELFNDHEEFILDWNIYEDLAVHEEYIISYINEIILNKYKRKW